MLLLFFSCKSHRNVSRSAVNQTRTQSIITTTDSSTTHRETSLDSEAVKKEETNTYTIRTEFGPDNNVASITETWNNINLQIDFKSQLDEIKREDLKLIKITQTTDTASTVIKEVIDETTDGRLIQGWEWAIIILTIAGIAVGLYALYFNRKRL